MPLSAGRRMRHRSYCTVTLSWNVCPEQGYSVGFITDGLLPGTVQACVLLVLPDW